MGRPRRFDEAAVVAAAVGLFADRAYDGLSVDDLVTSLGVHRNSLYQTFGSKRGLYLRALRRAVDQGLVEVNETGFSEDVFNFLLMACVDRAAHDPEVAAEVARAFAALDVALGGAAATELLGLRVRSRVAPSGRTCEWKDGSDGHREDRG